MAPRFSITVLQFFDFLNAPPPLRPLLGMENQIPDFFLRGFEASNGDEFVVGHILSHPQITQIPQIKDCRNEFFAFPCKTGRNLRNLWMRITLKPC